MTAGALLAGLLAASGLPWFKIEAIAVGRTGTRLLFGIRNVGKSYGAPKDVALVVRCALANDRDWKHLFAGYEQSDGLFTRIDPRP